MKLTVPKVALFLPVLMSGGALALIAPTSGQTAEGAPPPVRSAQTLPAALRPVLYQTFADGASPAYRINAKGCAVLPRSSLKACFDSQGAHFTGKKAALSLHLVAWGRGETVASADPVQPQINGGRVSYSHGDLSEWWRMLPVGFEQGFTLTKRPAGHGELMLTLAASGRAAQHEETLAWGKLRYGGLVVTDAKGRIIPATLTSKADGVLIAVNDAHASYPLTVDPLVWLEQRVTASDGAASDAFGNAVAVSGDEALIGAPGATINGNFLAGAVYAFHNDNGVWTQTQKLIPNDSAAFSAFGTSLVMDGDRVLIGAPLATETFPAQGAAYIFTLANGTWTQTAKLTADDGAVGNDLGFSLALQGDTAIVGSWTIQVGDNPNQGAAYVFTDSGGTWTQAQKLVASDGAAGDQFASAIAMDGSTALIAANGATINGNAQQGKVYIFTESGGTWSQGAQLTATGGGTGDYFGNAIALHGNEALIAADNATVKGNVWQGAVYAFTESDGTWTQTQELTASDGAAQSLFGSSLAFNNTLALIGAAATIVNGNDGEGAVYSFANNGAGGWTESGKLVPAVGITGEAFGSALSLEGNNALIGAYQAYLNGNNEQGAAYFYGQTDLGLAMSAPQTVGQGQTYVSQTIATNDGSAASPAVSATITVPAAASFVSAMASQGSCSEASSTVTCDFGAIDGNAGTATANVTLKATGSVGDTIDNVSGIARATPPLTASAATTITAGGACPDGYSEYDGTLNPGEVARSPVYQAPGGSENAILTAPEGFQLYAVYQSGRFGRHIYLVPGNEVHRWGPKGLYMWLVRARDGEGAYTLCLQHP